MTLGKGRAERKDPPSQKMQIKAKGKVAKKGKSIAMIAKEKEAPKGLRLLHHLVGREKEALRRQNLLRYLWGKERDPSHHPLHHGEMEMEPLIVHPRLRRLVRIAL
jgi:DNA-binding response OmpR family regulator